ncbi:MAG: hypothetical protein HRT57_04505 [Crocinitomicaceae bacterium]|nr:hypothetical protein [Crocinitomicaceae bacterium]
MGVLLVSCTAKEEVDTVEPKSKADQQAEDSLWDKLLGINEENIEQAKEMVVVTKEDRITVKFDAHTLSIEYFDLQNFTLDGYLLAERKYGRI